MNHINFSARKHNNLDAQINIYLTDHCNLGCKGCVAFAPLADKKFLDTQIFEKDIQRLAQLNNGGHYTQPSFVLLGGEPLLHPNLYDIIIILREYFPFSTIKLITNGILLQHKKDDFYTFLKQNDIYLIVSLYILNMDYENFKKTADKYKVKFGFQRSRDKWIQFKFHTSPLSEIQVKKNFLNCYQNNSNCMALAEGKFYPCNEAARWYILNKKLPGFFPCMHNLGIDIHKAKNLEEILDFVSAPSELCKYCGIDNQKRTQWSPSLLQLNEWVEGIS